MLSLWALILFPRGTYLHCLLLLEERSVNFFFLSNSLWDQRQNVRHACNIYQCRGRRLSGSILFLSGYLFAVSPTRDRIIVSIDPARSIALRSSSLQVFSTHRNSNRWRSKWFPPSMKRHDSFDDFSFRFERRKLQFSVFVNWFSWKFYFETQLEMQTRFLIT